MRALEGLINLLAVPLQIIFVFGNVASGIWLIFIGEWRAVVYAIAAFTLFALFMRPLLKPAFLFEASSEYYYNKKLMAKALFFVSLNKLYIANFITVWCISVFSFFTKDATSSSMIPLFFWSYGVAILPLTWMHGPHVVDPYLFLAATIFPQAGYIAMLVMMLFFHATHTYASIVFVGVMLLGLVLQLNIAIQMERETSSNNQ